MFLLIVRSLYEQLRWWHKIKFYKYLNTFRNFRCCQISFQQENCQTAETLLSHSDMCFLDEKDLALGTEKIFKKWVLNQSMMRKVNLQNQRMLEPRWGARDKLILLGPISFNFMYFSETLWPNNWLVPLSWWLVPPVGNPGSATGPY